MSNILKKIPLMQSLRVNFLNCHWWTLKKMGAQRLGALMIGSTQTGHKNSFSESQWGDRRRRGLEDWPNYL